jgi:uncharacterized protein (DUF2147 family)
MSAACRSNPADDCLSIAAPRKDRRLSGIGHAALVSASWCLAAFANAADIDGRWLTFDADTGEKRSIVEITRTNDSFRGRIVELFVQPGEPLDPDCDACSGDQHGKKIRGMDILLLSPATTGTGYAGSVLDPEEGRLYKCSVTLDAAGKKLLLRGYVGIPLFGRSAVWQRIE